MADAAYGPSLSCVCWHGWLVPVRDSHLCQTTIPLLHLSDPIMYILLQVTNPLAGWFWPIVDFLPRSILFFQRRVLIWKSLPLSGQLQWSSISIFMLNQIS